VDARGLAQSVAERYARFGAVEAVALSGSRTSRQDDASSDIDLYVYTSAPLTLEQRAGVALRSPRAEIGNNFWEPGDEWIDGASGISLDVMFRDKRWIEEQLDRVLVHHAASVGYSTCFWYNVLHSEILFDRDRWFGEFQARASIPYPSALKAAIIAKNFPILRSNMSSYVHQIELAIARKDNVSLNHRVTALLASYFDILFAVNEVPHPGEKRLVQYVVAHCSKKPPRLELQVGELLGGSSRVDASVVTAASNLVADLEALLRAENALPGQ
jgi:hypothetical protein